MKKIYLDYAAATPVDKKVLAAMQPYLTDLFYNPSALYLASRQVAEALTEARQNVAKWLGARSSEIIFTAGGTEANNLAVQGIMTAYPGANVLISAIEHESVIKPAGVYDCRNSRVDTQGFVDLEDVKQKINDQTVLVSIIYANNEIGVIQPLAQIGRLLENVRRERAKSGNKLPLYFHTDACQAANYLSLNASRLGVDLMTLNGGKIYGPKQSGALYMASHVEFKPVILGGGQERGLRSGTENVPSIVGFAAAINLVQSRRQTESKRMHSLQQLFLELLADKIPGCIINGSTKSRLVSNINISIPGQDNERLVMLLDEAGVQCASGSACSALKGEPSSVLRAIGLDDDLARGSLRFTIGTSTDETAVRAAVECLSKIL